MSSIGELVSSKHQRPAIFLQNFDELRNQCLKKNIEFDDPEFQPYNLSVSHQDLQKNQIEWLRPKVSIYLKYILLKL